jgi:hypothetical protein
MKIKRLFTVILCGIILFSLAACNQKNEDYKSKLISVINKQETATVQDIFSFEFDRAYVFNFTDGYMDGEEFAKKYNLDISITQVEAGQADYIQRIVFVDKSGSFVYEFQCIMDDVSFIESGGVIIYPETIIERTAFEKEQLTIRFESSERYDTEATF